MKACCDGEFFNLSWDQSRFSHAELQYLSFLSSLRQIDQGRGAGCIKDCLQSSQLCLCKKV